jgi:hypothetical protein
VFDILFANGNAREMGDAAHRVGINGQAENPYANLGRAARL